jgi:hypothetical protein
MEHDPNAMNDADRNPADATSLVEGGEGGFSIELDGCSAIGYEAADPSLHAPFWNEALLGNPPKRNLR